MIITKERLENLYIGQNLTIRQCAERLGLPTSGGISWRLKKFGIHARPGKFQVGNRKIGDRPPEKHGSWNGGKKKVECSCCKRELSRFPSHIHERNFCSGNCRGKWESDNFKGKNNPNFGNSILAGERNPNWKNGLSREPYPITWSFRLREIIRKRDNKKCQFCGVSQNGRRHCVHHIDYNKKNIISENLVTLCHKCHGKTAYHRKKWQEYFTNQRQIPLPIINPNPEPNGLS